MLKLVLRCWSTEITIKLNFSNVKPQVTLNKLTELARGQVHFSLKTISRIIKKNILLSLRSRSSEMILKFYFFLYLKYNWQLTVLEQEQGH
jgi:hypothetical protein